jgi:hypothetical protein
MTAKGGELKVVLISTYELGHQPFGLASPAAWLGEAGAEVACVDLSRAVPVEVSSPPIQGAVYGAIRAAEVIAFYLPMHTATRLAVEALPRIRSLNPRAHLCFYGLYAPLNEVYLRRLGAQTILGGEFEEGLVELVKQLTAAEASGSTAESVAGKESEQPSWRHRH